MSTNKKKKLITTGLLAGLVAGGGAGMILTSTGFAGASSSGAAAVTAVDDSTPTDAGTTGTGDPGDRPDGSTRLADVLQPLVDDGTITADQLTAIVSTLEAARPMGGPGDGMGPGGRGMGGRGMGGEGLTAVADALGLTVDELRTSLQDGQTLAEVAAAQGVDAQTVIDTLVVAAGEHLAEEVTEGDMTQDEADAKLAEITTRITDAVNNGGPIGGGRGDHGPRGPMGGSMGDHMGDDADGDAA